MLLDAVTEAMSCQHEQSFYQSDEGAGGFEKVSWNKNINETWRIGSGIYYWSKLFQDKISFSAWITYKKFDILIENFSTRIRF